MDLSGIWELLQEESGCNSDGANNDKRSRTDQGKGKGLTVMTYTTRVVSASFSAVVVSMLDG